MQYGAAHSQIEAARRSQDLQDGRADGIDQMLDSRCLRNLVTALSWLIGQSPNEP